MTTKLPATGPEKVLLITDVFQNISQVPVAVENHLDTSTETTDSLYSDVEQVTQYDYASTEDYSDYFYDEFTNYTSSQYSDDYKELNDTPLSRRDEIWNEFDIRTGQLNYSDLYNLDGSRWDARANFLEGVVGNLFLVPLAFIVGLCIGMIIWGMFVFVRKLLISLIKCLKSTSLPQVVDDICCVKILHFKPKVDKTKTVWYEDSLGTINTEKESGVSQSQKLSDIRKDTSCSKDNAYDKLHSHHNAKEKNIDENNNHDTGGNLKGRKISNSTFFLSNGVCNGVEFHQLSGKYKYLIHK